MTDFEKYALDQFPLRDGFRTLKSLFHQYVLLHGDNNGIYLQDGYAAKQEYPLKEDSVSHAMERLNHIYDKYLTDAKVYMAVIPDKGYYLAEANGYPAMDYEKLFAQVRQGMPWADYADITGQLTAGDYYFTDTHWRQERIGDVADALCKALGADWFREGELTPTPVERPFYGVYYGQAALPMDAELLYVMSGDVVDNCTVYNH